MFESLNVQGFNLSNSAALSLYASGRKTGIVMDCGEGVTHVVPIVEGFPIYHAMSRVDLAGQDVTAYLQRMFSQKRYSFQTPGLFDIELTNKQNLHTSPALILGNC